jgi:Fatty acid desaturase
LTTDALSLQNTVAELVDRILKGEYTDKKLLAAETTRQANPIEAPTAGTSTRTPRLPAHHLARAVASYAAPDPRRSILQLLSTIIPMAALWTAMVISVNDAYWVTLSLSVPAAAFLVRLFMIQHDCGHRSFFRSPRLNDLLGHAIGVLTLTPHGYWRKAHCICDLNLLRGDLSPSLASHGRCAQTLDAHKPLIVYRKASRVLGDFLKVVHR